MSPLIANTAQMLSPNDNSQGPYLWLSLVQLL